MTEYRLGKSSTVFVDKENDIVIKKFDKEQSKEYVRGPGYHCYLRELECLERLQGHKNFPKLIRYDDEDLTIKGLGVNSNMENILNNIGNLTEEFADKENDMIQKNVFDMNLIFQLQTRLKENLKKLKYLEF